MGNKKLMLQADDIAVPINRQIMRNLRCFLPGTSLISTLLKNKSFLSFFTY